MSGDRAPARSRVWMASRMASCWLFLALTMIMAAGCGASVTLRTATATADSRNGNRDAEPGLSPQLRRTGGAAGAGDDRVSAGCALASAVAPGTSANEAISSGGQQRSYRLHVPSGYVAGQAVPLLLMFHGDGGDGAGMEAYTGTSALADQRGFLVAYPNGLPTPLGWTAWGGVGRNMPAVDDVQFVANLLDTVSAGYCVDPRRIYAMGFSRGGGMAALLACRLSGRIAAVAPVSGSFFGSIEDTCAPGRPVPILEFHGSADRVVPYAGGGEGYLAVPAWLAGWATRDGCVGGPQFISPASGVTGEQWTTCAGGAAVVHYRLEGAGHAWPGGAGSPAGSPQALNASAVAWSFFQAHPLPK